MDLNNLKTPRPSIGRPSRGQGQMTPNKQKQVPKAAHKGSPKGRARTGPKKPAPLSKSRRITVGKKNKKKKEERKEKKKQGQSTAAKWLARFEKALGIGGQLYSFIRTFIPAAEESGVTGVRFRSNPTSRAFGSPSGHSVSSSLRVPGPRYDELPIATASPSLPSVSSSRSGTVEFMHRLYYGTISTGEDVLEAGSPVASIALRPDQWGSNWTRVVTSGFSSWRLRGFVVTYTNICIDVAGQLRGYVSPIPDMSLPDAKQELKIAAAHAGGEPVNVSQSHSWIFTDTSWKDVTSVDGDDRWTTAGTFELIAGSDLPANTQFGTLDIGVMIDLAEPTEGYTPLGSVYLTKTTVDNVRRLFSGSSEVELVDDETGGVISWNLPYQVQHSNDAEPYDVLMMPPGYYDLVIEVKGTSLTAVNPYARGDYRFLYVGSTYDQTSVVNDAGTQATLRLTFCSNGLADIREFPFASLPAGLCLVANAGSTITSSRLMINHLDGTLIEQPIVQGQIRSMQKELDAMKALLLKEGDSSTSSGHTVKVGSTDDAPVKGKEAKPKVSTPVLVPKPGALFKLTNNDV